MNSELDGCIIETFADCCAKLKLLNDILAKRYNLKQPFIITKLFFLDTEFELVEDGVVADWNEALSSFIDWCECGYGS